MILKTSLVFALLGRLNLNSSEMENFLIPVIFTCRYSEQPARCRWPSAMVTESSNSCGTMWNALRLADLKLLSVKAFITFINRRQTRSFNVQYIREVRTNLILVALKRRSQNSQRFFSKCGRQVWRLLRCWTTSERRGYEFQTMTLNLETRISLKTDRQFRTLLSASGLELGSRDFRDNCTGSRFASSDRWNHTMW